jgi:tRNA U34 5-carboxymethylaminomethyl modifying GTPase MnmE/TrmE
LITGQSGTEHSDRLTLNRRHEERLEEAVKTLGQAADETDAGREDVTAMLLRQSYEILGGLERENVSEKILDSIFSRFCIGK